MEVQWNEHLSRDPTTCGGETVIQGTRVLLRTVLGYLADGASVETIRADYPSVSEEDLRAVIAFAATEAARADGSLLQRSGAPRVAAPRGRVRIHPKGTVPIQLDRLSDDETLAIGAWTTPMLVSRACGARRAHELAKVYFAARTLFGPSSRRFDEHKATFSFPLLASGRTAEGRTQPTYLLHLSDFNGRVEVQVRHVEATLPSRMASATLRAPADGELDQAALQHLEEHFVGYLCGRAEALVASGQPIDSFVHVIRNVHVVYGLLAGDWFERELRSADECEGVAARLQQDFAVRPLEREAALVRALIEGIVA